MRILSPYPSRAEHVKEPGIRIPGSLDRRNDLKATIGRRYGKGVPGINDGPCSIEGCERPAACRGYCNMHYTRFLKHGDPLHVAEQGAVIRVRDKQWSTAPKWAGVTCKWAACEKPAKVHGLCRGHNNVALFSKEHEHLIPEAHRQKRCTVEGCDHPEYGRKGFCRSHLGKAQRGTLNRAQERWEAEMGPSLESDLSTVGGRIRTARVERGWTRQQLAHALGYTEDSVTQREKSETSTYPAVIHAYAKALDVDPLTLLPENLLPDQSTAGGRLTARRYALGLTLEHVARVTGYSRERIRQIEAKKELDLETERMFEEAISVAASEEPQQRLPLQRVPSVVLKDIAESLENIAASLARIEQRQERDHEAAQQ